jgi:hypothetical protein
MFSENSFAQESEGLVNSSRKRRKAVVSNSLFNKGAAD